MTIGSSTWER